MCLLEYTANVEPLLRYAMDKTALVKFCNLIVFLGPAIDEAWHGLRHVSRTRGRMPTDVVSSLQAFRAYNTNTDQALGSKLGVLVHSIATARLHGIF